LFVTLQGEWRLRPKDFAVEEDSERDRHLLRGSLGDVNTIW